MRKKYYKPVIKQRRVKINLYSRGNYRYINSIDLLTADNTVLLASGCCATCFLSDTKILLESGDTKSIKDIRVGELVYSYDLATNKLVKNKVLEKLVHPNSDGNHYLIINNKLKVTPNHAFWVNNHHWKRADQLTFNDTLLNSRGEQEKIKQIIRVDGMKTTYNLHMAGDQTNYFAENILVHNANAIT